MRFHSWLPVVAALFTATTLKAQSAPAVMAFDGRDFWMKSTEGSPDGAYTAQYYPRAETSETWTERFTLRIVPANTDAEAVADDVVKRVLARKAGDRFAAASAFIYGTDGSTLVDFTVSDGPETVERNFHRYIRSDDRLFTYQYTRRLRFTPGDTKGTEKFFADNAIRTTRYIAELERPDLPLRPPVGEEEKLIRAAAVRSLVSFEKQRENDRTAIRSDFRAKKITGAEAATRLAAIDATPPPRDDAIAALAPVPLKPSPSAASRVKQEQRQEL